ncbi:MAG: aminotransferase class III-fold pyridoxal phosphate-dependent enzyme, partial [Draconibacterium sp.]|nr:aminotransferase class III-fold pyridoxal phosphate-dependent enzyme [Draconibacterium sp.]
VHIVSEYHKVLPLENKEIDILYWLIAARLCTTVCNSAYERIQRPENSYIQISEKPAWELLKIWVTINPIFVRNEFRKAAGFEIQKTKEIETVKKKRLKSISSIFSISYKKPIYMESAAFQYMFDKYGNSYLDAYNNIPHVGHSHPRVVEAGQKQMAKLNTNTRYLYDWLNNYSANLLNYFPKPLNKVFMVNSGSAASDLALRLARNFTNKSKIAVLEYGYHGNMKSTIEISHYKFSGKGGKGTSKNVMCLPIPDSYRGEFRDENAGLSYAKSAIQQINNSDENIAAFIAEPIVGCAGQVPLAKGYLNDVYTAVRNQGGICISDEVQTGFGRLGDVFWGFEKHKVIPDIVILGKPMGNGHPIGAVITTDKIASAFNNGMEFFSSFGGNPVSCAIGQAVLDVIEEEHLQQNAKNVGDYYIQKLNELQLKYECIGDVRGSGLFIGFEFVKNRLTLEPDTELAQKVKNELRNNLILVDTDGPYNSVIKSKPPLCFTKGNVDEIIGAIDSIL